MGDETREYSNGEITVVWKPSLCSHSTRCWKNGLGEVFDPRKKPWINMSGADSEKIVEQVSKCPSRALSIKSQNAVLNSAVEVETNLNGPLIIKGAVEIIHHDGKREMKQNGAALCRCGHSSNKPYCDGSHKQHQFE